ncbi:deoxyribodipyrimidine photolyase [Idiomarina sp. OT37-5b]|uniref:DASH family cryptochrome n=1 Tax=Idiomarina sp. OT37-5b TaxID=2100422 RepID=UPI000CF98041|nr:DASH family cryptochrome [Idiomarina sp. OT37-5b]AVJ56203.1 deoxyribodipyrimidine photolyase [Idiomarina sp. OT37-5b]
MTKRYARSLYWFTHDLRLNDNPALTAAQDSSAAITFCYVLDKASLTRGRYGMPALGQHRLSFILQSLHDLQRQLQAQGHTLTVRVGEPLDEMAQLISTLQVDAVFGALQAGVYERRRWQQLQQRFRFLDFHQLPNSTLLSEDDLPGGLQQLAASFSQFRKPLEPLAERFTKQALAAPNWQHRALSVNASADLPEAGESWLAGGETAALQHLQRYFSSAAPGRYKETRNALDGFDQSTKLSAYLAHGNLSPQQVINALRDYEQQHGENESTYWIAFELLWRDYFFWYLLRYQEQVFAFTGVAGRKPQTTFYPTRFKQWCAGQTPYPLVNACMHQLNQTGYLSNRGRQIVASCLVNEMAVDWRYGAAYFEQQLLDYDIGSNWGNWQYIAGVGADPRGGRHFNIDKQTAQFDPDGHYIERWKGQQTRQLDVNDAADWPITAN